MMMSATTSSTIANVSKYVLTRSGTPAPTRASMPSANAVSVDMAVPQPSADARPVLPILIDSSVPHAAAYPDGSMFAQASAAIVAASSTAALPVSVRRNRRSGVSSCRAHAVLSENCEAGASGFVITGFSPAPLGRMMPATRRAAWLGVTEQAIGVHVTLTCCRGLRLEHQQGDADRRRYENGSDEECQVVAAGQRRGCGVAPVEEGVTAGGGDGGQHGQPESASDLDRGVDETGR